jgi:hypothetical protein
METCYFASKLKRPFLKFEGQGRLFNFYIDYENCEN